MSKKTSAPRKSKSSGNSLKTKVRRATTLGQELIEAVGQMKAIERGEMLPTRQWEVLPDGSGGFTRRQIFPTGAELATVARKASGLSQDKFAALIGVPSGTLRCWEQGRREPTGAARVLLMVAAQHPWAIREIVASRGTDECTE